MNNNDDGLIYIRQLGPTANYFTSNEVNVCYLSASAGREFFRHHPASLRRTAELIAERVASNAIKKLQQTALKAVMTECVCFPVVFFTDQ